MIRRLQFHRFKSLQRAALDVGAVNLLIGANAAGKSNVVRGFRFIADAIKTDVETAIAPLGGTESARAPRRDMRSDTLDPDAANLVNVLRTLSDTPTYATILHDLHSLIETIEGIETAVDRGRVSLLLREQPFADPVEVLSVSDGTLRILALLTALHLMPEHALLCVEEPEHGIHPLVFGPLLDLVRERCPEDGARQVIMTTHSPDLVDAARPQEVVIVERDEAGRTVLLRPDWHKLRRWLQDFRLGELWRMRQLGGVPA